MWVNLYWDMTAVKESEFLEQNIVFCGKAYKDKDQALITAIVKDCKLLRYISTVEVPIGVAAKMGWVELGWKEVDENAR